MSPVGPDENSAKPTPARVGAAAADAVAAELGISRRQVYVLRTGQRYPVSMTDQYKLLIKGLAGGMTIALIITVAVIGIVALAVS